MKIQFYNKIIINMISLNNGVNIKLRIPPSIMTKESEFLHNSQVEFLLSDKEYNFIKKWIYNIWISKYNSYELKKAEKTTYLNSKTFTKFYKTKYDIHEICQLFVKETFTKRGFLYLSQTGKFDGIVQYNDNHKLLIKLSINTFQSSCIENSLYDIFFKYTQIIEKLRENDDNIEMIIISCAKQQDDDNAKRLIDCFKNTNTSSFMNNFIKLSKISGILDCIIIRDLENWITKSMYL